MRMSISEERCAVAEAIRHYAEESDESAYEFIHGYWPNDLADLIDPICRMTDSEWDNGERTWGCICSACDAHIEHTYSFSLDLLSALWRKSDRESNGLAAKDKVVILASLIAAMPFLYQRFSDLLSFASILL